MSTAIVPNSAQIRLPEAIESALIYGDLEKLDAPGRLSYYKAVCESLGLNPLTKPFDYIKLNNKLTLYAKRDCTDQLRRIHGVSISNLEAEQIGDLFVVKAQARDRSDRTDFSTGAVTTAGLKGEALANAMMKAETKAKRRVTLSLCGLGFLDETEVDSIPDARRVADPPPAPAPAPPKQVASPATPNLPRLNGSTMVAFVNDVMERSSQKGGKPLMAVKIKGFIDSKDLFACWHMSMKDALIAGKGQVCQFEVEKSNGYLNIMDVLAVGDQEYRDGKPYTENRDADRLNPEITDDDIPF